MGRNCDGVPQGGVKGWNVAPAASDWRRRRTGGTPAVWKGSPEEVEGQTDIGEGKPHDET